MLQTDTDTHTGPVSAQALQLTPDRGHAVVENLERASELCIAAGSHRPAAHTLPTSHKKNTFISDVLNLFNILQMQF